MNSDEGLYRFVLDFSVEVLHGKSFNVKLSNANII
jgi:hypothetical protein